MAQHTDKWYENQNQALGLPPGTRHPDLWYQMRRQEQEAAARDEEMRRQQEQFRLQQEAVHKEQQNQGYYQQQQGQQQAAAAKAEADRIAAEKVAADKAAADKLIADKAAADKVIADEAALQAKQKGWRDDWDRINQQGAYDPDGWQSIGYQAMPLAMPQGWEGGATVPPAATPPPGSDAARALGQARPMVPGTPDPARIAALGAGPRPMVAGTPDPARIAALEAGPRAPAPTNALAQLLGKAGQGQGQPQSQPWTQQPAGQAQPAGLWGTGGQNPYAGQQPDPGAWGQVPTASKSAAPQSWAQPAGQNLGLWGQKPRTTPGAQLWGQKPAGTWGSGRGWGT